jgi:hypothetical protein
MDQAGRFVGSDGEDLITFASDSPAGDAFGGHGSRRGRESPQLWNSRRRSWDDSPPPPPSTGRPPFTPRSGNPFLDDYSEVGGRTPGPHEVGREGGFREEWFRTPGLEPGVLPDGGRAGFVPAWNHYPSTGHVPVGGFYPSTGGAPLEGWSQGGPQGGYWHDLRLAEGITGHVGRSRLEAGISRLGAGLADNRTLADISRSGAGISRLGAGLADNRTLADRSRLEAGQEPVWPAPANVGKEPVGPVGYRRDRATPANSELPAQPVRAEVDSRGIERDNRPAYTSACKEEINVGKNKKFSCASLGVKLGMYNGTTCLETFLAKFDNCAHYYEWSAVDQQFYLKAALEGPAGQLLWDLDRDASILHIKKLLRCRFGSDNQAERFRAELRSRKRKAGESLQSLYQDVCRLMALAYPGPTSDLSEIVGRDAFLEALNNQTLRVRVLEREPRTLDQALNAAVRLEAFDGVKTEVAQERDDWTRGRSKFAKLAERGQSNSPRDNGSLEPSTEPWGELRKTLADMSAEIKDLRQQMRDSREGSSGATLEGAGRPLINRGSDSRPIWQPGAGRGRGRRDDDTCRGCGGSTF